MQKSHAYNSYCLVLIYLKTNQTNNGGANKYEYEISSITLQGRVNKKSLLTL